MKRLLLPLIAALALPSAVNAETIYLECKFEGIEVIKVLGINPTGEIGTVSTTSSTQKAPQFITPDSYALKTSNLIADNTYTVSRINGLATFESTFKEAFVKVSGGTKYINRNGSCKKKEKVETLF